MNKCLPVVGLIVLVLVSIIGCRIYKATYYAAEIDRVLTYDLLSGISIRSDMSMLESLFGASSSTIDATVVGMREISLRGCPRDFRRAFKIHIEAWAQYAKIHRETDWLDPERKHATERIGTTYAVCLEVARSYGVDVTGAFR